MSIVYQLINQGKIWPSQECKQGWSWEEAGPASRAGAGKVQEMSSSGSVSELHDPAGLPSSLYTVLLFSRITG